MRKVRDSAHMETQSEIPNGSVRAAVQIDKGECATVSLAEAAKVLGIHRSTVWELHRRGKFPIPVLQIGSRLRVPKVHLERFLLCGEAA